MREIEKRVKMEQALILASSSPFRRELLGRLQLPFCVDSPDIDESRLTDESPVEMVRRLSIEKAKAVAVKYPKHLIIGSDQVSVRGDTIIGKPGCHENAVQQLRHSSGKVVHFLTGLCLYDSINESYQVDVLPFKIHFRELSDAEIEAYLGMEQPYHCAGSFKAEGLGVTLFKKLEGDDPSIIIGLPLIRLCEMLRVKGVSLPQISTNT